jgi:hypothetical protein
MLLGNIVTNVGPRNSLKHLVKKNEGRIFRIHFFLSIFNLNYQNFSNYRWI